MFNLTTQSARKRETVREMEAEVRRKHGFKGPIKTVLREILNATNQNQTLCKCLCRRVGEMDLIHGLYKQMEQMAEEAKKRLENPHLAGGGGGMGGMGGGGDDEEYEYGEDYGNYDDLEDTGADEDTGFDT